MSKAKGPLCASSSMLKLAFAKRICLIAKIQSSLFTWSLSLFIGFLMWLECLVDPESLGIHVLLFILQA
jgi:hypothetical protein